NLKPLSQHKHWGCGYFLPTITLEEPYMVAENLDTKEKIYVLRDLDTGIIIDVTSDRNKAINDEQAERNIKEILNNNGY
ncbi:hypothetical protein AALB53_17945, partial [Lachnospiraceae bacterium 47-T17]